MNLGKRYVKFSYELAMRLGLGPRKGQPVRRYQSVYVREDGTYYTKVYGRRITVFRGNLSGYYDAVEHF
jgi:hypothetical protein